jgi:hypothetical protein
VKTIELKSFINPKFWSQVSTPDWRFSVNKNKNPRLKVPFEIKNWTTLIRYLKKSIAYRPLSSTQVNLLQGQHLAPPTNMGVCVHKQGVN